MKTETRLTRKLRVGALLLVGAALLILYAWPRARQVDIALVDRATVQETIEAEGRTRVRDRHVIAAPAAGQLRRIMLAPGDAVVAGQVLAWLDASASAALDPRSRSQAQSRAAGAQAQWQAAQARERAAMAAVAQARADVLRLEPLAAQGMVSAEALQHARTAQQQADLSARAAGFQTASAAQELAAARAALDDGSGQAGAPWALRSPVTGIVLKRHHESPTPVAAGEPLLEVGDINRLEVAVDVLSRDAVTLAPGQSVTLLRWGGEPALQGRVRLVEPVAFTKLSALGVEEQRVWVLVDITSPRADWERLGEGYRVNARFVLREATQTLRVPRGTLVRHGSQWTVFRVEGGRVRQTGVDVVLQGDGMAAIQAGLKEGDRVLQHPPSDLRDGERVRTPAD